MKQITTLVLLFFMCALNAQIIKDFPVDEAGAINFNQVVAVDSVSQAELYARAKIFFANNFKSAKNVIEMEDKDTGTIIGKGNTNFTVLLTNITMSFSIKIQAKDGRYKYEIYDITYPGQYGNFPASDWFSEEAYYKKNGKPRSINETYKEKTLAAIESLKKSIAEAMNAPKQKSNW